MRMPIHAILGPVILAFMFTNPAWAADPAAGESTYQSRGCVGCHGPGGQSAIPEMYPTLSGKTAEYITEQLTAFRDGTRQNPMMSPMASSLTDEDIANLAAHLSGQ